MRKRQMSTALMTAPRLAAAVALFAGGLARGPAPAAAAEPATPPRAEAPFVLNGGARNAPFPLADGRAIYEHLCQACHMPGGRGATLGPGSYPALAGNARLAVKLYPALLVVNGQGAMPPFGTLLDDAQVAAVVNYVRGNFGNAFADRATAADVAALRPGMQALPVAPRGR
jgi:mono/diheme cytochrome c family protein